MENHMQPVPRSLDYDSFREAATRAVEEKLPPGVAVEARRIKKNNGRVLDGLTFSKEGKNASPTIYLDDLYKFYVGGMPLDDMAEGVVQASEDARSERLEALAAGLRDFDRVKGRVVFRLVNRKMNEELLKEIPHVGFLDLAIVFAVLLSVREEGEASALVRNGHLALWGASADELYALARENTPRLLGWSVKRVSDILNGLARGMGEAPAEHPPLPMLVLTNKAGHWGAAAALYDGLLSRVADRMGDDLWVIPSSVHETLVLPRSFGDDAEGLAEMIRDVNAAQVPDEEVLSDHPYQFSRKDGRIRMPERVAAITAGKAA